MREQLADGPARADTGFEADRVIEGQLKQLEDHDLNALALADTWSAIRTGFAEHIER